MPRYLTVKCKKCRKSGVIQEIFGEQDVVLHPAQWYEGVCPYCGAEIVALADELRVVKTNRRARTLKPKPSSREDQ
jgi:predicted RNA-binding Zn-ribbon protein involved in translation (DUF1610 family)